MKFLTQVVGVVASLLLSFKCSATVNLNTASARLWFPELAENTTEFMSLCGQVDTIQTDAAKGDPIAICRLGKLSLWGVGVKRSTTKSFELFKKSAALGCAEAYKCMSTCYGLGIGVAKDEGEMYRLLVKSAQGGYIPAMLSLGMDKIGKCGAYQKGKTCNGETPDCPLYWYRMAVDKGSLEAKLLMADVYAPIFKGVRYEGFDGRQLGHNLHRDLHTAAALLKELATCKDDRIVGKAAYKIGMLLAITSHLTTGGDAAYRWFEKGAYYWNEDARHQMEKIESQKFDSDTLRERMIDRTELVRSEQRRYRYTYDELSSIFERGCDCVEGKPGYSKRMSPMDAIVLTRYYYPEDYAVLDDKLNLHVYLSSRRFGDEKPIFICRCNEDGEMVDFDLNTIEKVKQRRFIDDFFYIGMTIDDARRGAEKYYAPEAIVVENVQNGRRLMVKNQEAPLCVSGKDDVVWRFNFGRTIYSHWFNDGAQSSLTGVLSKKYGVVMPPTNVSEEVWLTHLKYTRFSRHKNAPSPDVKEDFDSTIRYFQQREMGTVSNIFQVAILGKTRIEEDNKSTAPKLADYYPNYMDGDLHTISLEHAAVPAWVKYVKEELSDRISKFDGEEGIVQITSFR